VAGTGDGASGGSSLLYVLRSVAGNRALRRVELAFATFNCGELASWVAMLVYAYAEGGVTEAGIVATALLLPAAAFAPVVAAWTERRDAGTALIAGYVAQALTCGVAAAALFADAHPLVVYAFFVGPSVAFTMTRPTQSAFAPGLARTPAELTATNVVTGWIESLSMLAAPALTGVFLAVGSPATVYAAAAAGCVLGAVLVAPLRTESARRDARRREAAETEAASPGGSLAFVRRDPQARVLLFLFAAQCIAIGALDVLTVELALGVLGRGGEWAGYLGAAFGAGGVVAVVVTARLVGLARLALPLVLSIAIWGVAFTALAGLPGALGMLLLLVVAGSARTIFDVAGRTLLQRVARPDLLARVFGLLEGMQMAAFAVGTLLAPLLVSVFGVPAALVCVGAILPLGAAVAGRRLLDIDRHATVPVVEIALLRSMPLFASLPPPTIESLARALEPVTFPAGVEIMRQGEEGDRFYVVAGGEVEIVRDGKEVATRQRGEGFGEIALIYDVPRTATVRTRTETQLYALEREPFLLAVTGHPSVHRAARDLADARLEEYDAVEASLRS
jgi:Cyclic nucleotide-binding domain